MAEHYDSNFDFWPIPDLPPGCIVSSEAAPKFKANEHDDLYAHALGVDLEEKNG
jgi:hypothetical protein